MPVKCPHCGREIPAADASLEQGLARCRTCNIVFSCGAARARTKPQVDMPRGFAVSQDGADFVLTRRWFTPAAFFLLFFCVFWDGFLVVWYAAAAHGEAPLIFKLFPIGHVAIGAGLTYAVAAVFVNRTIIRLGTQSLSVRHGPLPWPGDKDLARAEVEQLFCEERFHRGKRGGSYSYAVSVLMRGGRREALVTRLESPEQALFIESKVEAVMGLQDRPVTGEMRG